jgi:hypothetical protein
MTRFTPRNPQPIRRDLTDARSSGPSPAQRTGARLNDTRSTGRKA